MAKQKSKAQKEPQQQPEGKSNNTMMIVGIFVIVIIVLLGIITAMMVSNKEKEKSNLETTTNVNNVNTEEENVNVNASEEETVEETTEATVPAELKEIEDLKLTNPENVSEATYYSAGTITEKGLYKDYELILLSTKPIGPAFYPDFLRFVRKGDKLVLLKNHSSDYQYILDSSKIGKDFTIDEDTKLGMLTYTDITGPKKTRQALKLDTTVNGFFSEDGLKKSFVDDAYGQVYATDIDAEITNSINDRNGFYIKGNDGTVKVYSLKFDFFDDNGQPDITWDDTKEVDAYSTGEIGRCGAESYAAVVTPDVVNKDTELVETGTSSKGDPIYELKDKNHKLLKDMYEAYNPFETEKVTYEVFVKEHPMFFFVDSFDRLIKAQSNSFIPAAECGKPVVYLYPEQKTNVSVNVNVSGGMSISIPEYKNGWNVIASPDGTIYHPDTNQNYPYLFWEGRSKTIMPAVDQGFVVTQANIHTFLEEKLTKLGLNDKERADFEEFWEPRMQSAPYYFVTFLGNRVMDTLAPMNISPAPDTVIRVFMDFLPLQKPIQTREYNIKTPERKGFTVVEWGGTLNAR